MGVPLCLLLLLVGGGERKDWDYSMGFELVIVNNGSLATCLPMQAVGQGGAGPLLPDCYPIPSPDLPVKRERRHGC